MPVHFWPSPAAIKSPEPPSSPTTSESPTPTSSASATTTPSSPEPTAFGLDFDFPFVDDEPLADLSAVSHHQIKYDCESYDDRPRVIKYLDAIIDQIVGAVYDIPYDSPFILQIDHDYALAIVTSFLNSTVMVGAQPHGSRPLPKPPWLGQLDTPLYSLTTLDT